MKVYKAPSDVEVPQLSYVNGKLDMQTYREGERRYLARVCEHAKSLGYSGEHTGNIIGIPVADGQAQYMVLDNGRALSLMHLPLGDAWSVPEYMTRGMRKDDVLQLIEREKRLSALWASRASEGQKTLYGLLEGKSIEPPRDEDHPEEEAEHVKGVSR